MPFAVFWVTNWLGKPRKWREAPSHYPHVSLGLAAYGSLVQMVSQASTPFAAAGRVSLNQGRSRKEKDNVKSHAKKRNVNAGTWGLGRWVKLEQSDHRIAAAGFQGGGDTTPFDCPQKPIALKCLGQPMTQPAWKEKPSWFLIAENDRMVSPETQRYAAERMKSTIVSLPVDHSPLASYPNAVIGLISDAANSF